MTATMQTALTYFSSIGGSLFETWKNGDCVVMVGTETTDDRGNAVPAYTNPRTPGYDLPCVWKPRVAREVVVGGKATSVTVYPITLPSLYQGAAVVVLGSDRLKLRALVVNGVTVRPEKVLEIVAEPANTGATIELLCMEVE
jgi:hypothetical protein